jgi:hypothetical protein
MISQLIDKVSKHKVNEKEYLGSWILFDIN